MKKFLYTALSFAVACAAVCSGAACGTKSETLEGDWIFSSATLNGVNASSDFEAYTASFSDDGNVRVAISHYGNLTTRNSRYTFDGVTVTEKYGSETYTYTADGDLLRTTFDDYGMIYDVVLEKKSEDAGLVAVDFEGVLFGTDMSDSKFFNYCPAILTETVDDEEIMHIWYCTNKDDGAIMDHIGYRKGVKQQDGKWLFSEQQIVLQPTEGTWDSRHTCDPAVIRGEFRYQGTQYRYLMAYLGCVTEDYGNNETGIAVSNAPEGPWIKIDTLNPIVPWQDYGKNDDGNWNWGTGMPALLSIDGHGEVLLFYQSGNRGTGIQRWDFSNLDDPDLQPKFTATLTSNGIVNSAGMTCRINIPDFAYDPVAKRFYVCGVTNEKNPADITPTRVNSHSMVAYLENIESMEDLCALLQTGTYTWKMAGYVGPADTGFERNHNPGIVRNEYGYLSDSSEIRVVVSTGHNSWALDNIFTYRLYGAVIKLT